MGISLRRRARRMAVKLAEMLPPPRHGAVRQLMRSSRDLMSGRAPANPPKAPKGAKVWAVPGTYSSPVVDVLDQLESGDVLFIGSSHLAKTGSDPGRASSIWLRRTT